MREIQDSQEIKVWVIHPHEVIKHLKADEFFEEVFPNCSCVKHIQSTVKLQWGTEAWADASHLPEWWNAVWTPTKFPPMERWAQHDWHAWEYSFLFNSYKARTLKNIDFQDFPGVTVIKTLHCQNRECQLDYGWGTEIPHDLQPKLKK